MKNALYRALRLVVATVLLVYVLTMIDFDTLLYILKGIDLRYLIAVLVSSVVAVLLSTYRWSILLRPLGLEVPMKTLVKFFMVGNFFNMIMPSIIGGDVMRVYELGGHSNRRIDSFSSVLVDRLSGLWACFAIAAFSLCLRWGLFSDQMISLLVLCCSAVFFITTLSLFSQRLEDAVSSLVSFLNLRSLEGKIMKPIYSMRAYRSHKKVILKAFNVSLIIRALGIINVYVLSLSVGWSVSVEYFFVFVPVINILTTIPVSLNGIGVREGAFIYLFSSIGTSATDAFTLSFLSFSWMVLSSLFGAPYYIFRR